MTLVAPDTAPDRAHDPTTGPPVRERHLLDVVPLSTAAVVVSGIGVLVVVSALVSRSLVLAVLAAAAAALALFLAQRPVLLALVAITLVPVTSGLRRDLPIPGYRLSEVLTVVTSIVVLGLCARALPGPRWRAWDFAALAYCTGAAAFGVLDALLHQVPITSADARVILGPVQFLLLYRVAAAAFGTEHLRVIAMRSVILASLPVSIFAALQQVGPPVFQDLAVSITGTGVFNTPGYDPVRRATSVFPIWHALAGYLLIVCLLVVALLLRRDRRVLPPIVLGVVLAAALIALVYSLTATIVAGLLIGVVVLGAILRRFVLVVTALVGATFVTLVAFFPLVSERIAAQSTSTPTVTASGDSFLPQTIQYRLDIWTEQYLPALHGSWLNGYGPADPPGVFWQHTESGYLTLILRGGLAYVAVAGLLVYLSWRSGRVRLQVARTASEAALAATVMALAVVLVIINLTFPYLVDSGLPQPMWVLWGLLAAAIGEGARGSAPRRATLRGDEPDSVGHLVNLGTVDHA